MNTSLVHFKDKQSLAIIIDLTILLSCSVSLLLTTTEAAVLDNPHDKNKPPSRVPDMDDLDL